MNPSSLIGTTWLRGGIASTVSDALNSIRNHHFDILVCDLNIAESSDRFTVATAMRRAHLSGVIVLLTGYPGFESALKGIRKDVDDYFVKPADYEALISTLEKRLASKSGL